MIVPESSGQKVSRLLPADTGAVGEVATVTVTLAHADCPHPDSQRAKYVEVTSGEAITSPSPTPISDPPHEPVNQRSVSPEPPLAESVIVPESSGQKVSRLLLAAVGASAPPDLRPESPVENAEAPQVPRALTK